MADKTPPPDYEATELGASIPVPNGFQDSLDQNARDQQVESDDRAVPGLREDNPSILRSSMIVGGESHEMCL